ncbi:flagellar biosynthetic protein FliO [Filobacillus milosensis]|uniref:Flagellar protein n=1 Tax=Filobacillus milosensis TaxID=94137 RepID=A0A4Y8IQT5_9BACI|nr:flagellar biosynthetic protein FliO [Filobacillus milosensis]TFB23201.1 flagellar biosynthetic protein FliO [Filobacillus milosensis]
MKTSIRLIGMAILTTVYLLASVTIVSADNHDNQSVEEKWGDKDSSENEQPQPNLNNNAGNEGELQSSEIGQSNSSLFIDFIKMLIALVFVLALIYFLLRFIQKRSKIYQQSRSLENIGGLSLGSNKSVQIIRVGNQYYLLGVGEDIQLLTEIEDTNTIEDINSYNNSGQESLSFQKVMNQFKRRDHNPYQEKETKRQFQTELQSMKNTRERLMKRYQERNEDSHD